ncbi:CUB domain [Trinorchestia longiramus]|nr:CUB domain [Trinorchestia longiramus]
MEVSRTPTTAAMLLMLLVRITQGFPRESNANSLLNETKSSPPPGVSPPMIEARGMVPNDGELWPLWLGERYVAYRYADDQVDKSAIAAGIGELEENTCLKFDNVASWHWGHHIIIKHHNTLCTALVGRKLRNMFGQEMLLSSDCTNDIVGWQNATVTRRCVRTMATQAKTAPAFAHQAHLVARVPPGLLPILVSLQPGTCATRTAPYTDALRRSLLPLNEQVTAAGTVTSPNHPTPNPDGTVFTKVIEAPVCQRVKLTFTAFEMASRCDDKTCCNEGIEIQEAPPTAPSTTDTGEWFCGEEVTSGQIFESAGSKLILLYFIKENPSNSNPGFSATIAFETIPNCVGFLRVHTCIRLSDWSCLHPLILDVSIPSFWMSPSPHSGCLHPLFLDVSIPSFWMFPSSLSGCLYPHVLDVTVPTFWMSRSPRSGCLHPHFLNVSIPTYWVSPSPLSRCLHPEVLEVSIPTF